MNKHLYRIIFNERRGQLMVVAEIASSNPGASSDQQQSRHASTRKWTVALADITLACLCAVGSVALLQPAQAQVVAYRNAPPTQQPTILQTSNGVPQVNIQTPSAAGVSRNVYSQFDVNNQGLILNNSRTNTRTQLSGWVQGNPWLATGSAKVILNEVNSSNPSYLNGYIEVAGQRAEVVIANPAGINVSGGGFINASKATLTTGTPILNNGNLEGYRVQAGHINVDGDGLDLSSTDYASLLTRSLQVNAGIWANELKVVTGTNEVSETIAHTAGTGTTPRFALDVSNLGGMYAGKIHLIGTEAGVGVRNAGTLGATAGDLVLQVNGLLTNIGTLRTSSHADIKADGLLNDKGTIASAGNASISTTQDIDNNQGLITATQTLTLQARHINNTAKAEISANQTQIKADQNLTNRGLIDGTQTELDATNFNNLGTGRVYGDHISIAARQLNNDVETVNDVTQTAVIAARNRLDLGVKNLINREHALIYSDGDMAIGGALDTNRQATGKATQIDNLSATIEAGKNLSIDTAILNNKNMHFSSEVQEQSKTAITELEGSGASKRYKPGDTGVEVFNDESDHLRTPDGTYDRWSKYQFTRTISETVVTSTDPSKILVGGNFSFSGETLNNDRSQLIAGGEFQVGAKNLNNLETKGVNIVNDVGSATSYWRQKNKGRDSTGSATAAYKPADVVTEVDLKTTQYISNNKPTGSGIAYTGVGRNISITNSMYTNNPAADADYLIETDPRFANQKKWLGSDYMAQSVGLDPSVTQKRLGDGFYEQKLIREQVASLTGKRFLGDYTSDEQEYQALMDNGITFAKQYNLRPGIALTDAQVAALTSDMVWLVEQNVTLADGSTQKVLAPQVYVRVQPGDIDGSGAVMSGKQVNLALSGDLTNAGTIAGRDVMQLNATNIHNLGGRLQGDVMQLSALQDINNVGGTISATNSISATAGRDINLQSTTQTTTGEQGSRTQLDRVAALYVSGASATLAVNAGRDINAQAAVIQNAGTGNTTLTAANNINLTTVQTQQTHTTVWDANNHRQDSASVDVGSQIGGGGRVTLQAGQTLSATAADVQAVGALNVDAKNIQLQAGQASQSVDEAHQHTSKGFLSKTTETTREASSSSTAVGSSFGGATVNLDATNDIAIKGSNVVGDNGTTLRAGNNVNIEAATNTSSSSSYRQETKSGLMSGGSLLSVSVGTRKQSLDSQDTTITAAASTVGSVGGNLNITAGNQYKQVGSDVLTSQGDINIQAKTVGIQEARETNKQSTEQKFEQSGLTVAINSGLIDNLQGAQKQQQAASQTKDSRMKALAVANEAASVVAAAQNVTKVDLTVSLGSSKSESKQTSTSDTARGSTVNAGGVTTIKATGGGEASNLTVQGSDVSGKAVNLEADNQVNLTAAQNTTTQTSTSSNSSASVGASIGTSGLGVTASASMGKGNGNGTDTSYTNTHIAGADSVSIKSGSDTHVKGATVEGNQVTATVGGNLNIESLQDTSTYAEKNQQAGGSVMVGITQTGLASGNVNYAKTNINSDYQSVTEQSGIKAGDGGSTVNVQGNTALVGGAITSTQAAIDNNKNSFNTGGTLTTSDIQNKAAYDAKSVSVNIGMGSTPGQSASSGMSGVGFGNDSGKANSTTTAGISGIAGDTSKRTGDAQQGIKQIFNKDQVKAEIGAQTAITQAFTAETAHSVQLVTNAMTADQKILLQTCDVGGQSCSSHAVDAKDVKVGVDGKIYVFNNGIFNNEPQALENAAKQSSDAANKQGVYVIVNPATGNPIAEVMYAAYDKINEIAGGVMPISNASQANIDVRNTVQIQGGQVVEVDHSRGSLTSSNATAVQVNSGQTNVPIDSVTFNGAAANAQRSANLLDAATSGIATQLQSTHKDDLVGTVIGGNMPTGGQNASVLDAHTNYGSGVDVDLARKIWGNTEGSTPQNVLPQKVK